MSEWRSIAGLKPGATSTSRVRQQLWRRPSGLRWCDPIEGGIDVHLNTHSTVDVPQFTTAPRLMTNLLAALEKRCLVWLAGRMPAGVNSDHLTALALFAMFMTGASYYAARLNPAALLLAVAWLGVNWFG